MRQGETIGSGESWSWAGVRFMAVATLLAAFAAFVVPSIALGENRQLDPVLSLIGGCDEPGVLDPVEDPGCPTTPPAGSHPPALFAVPEAVTTDFYGNIYVSNFGKLANGSQGRIDIFDPDGYFISELATVGPTSLAVDSDGYLYVVAEVESRKPILRFKPTVYKPEDGEIEYGEAPVELTMPGSSAAAIYTGIAINPANDHLFANFASAGLQEYDSAENGNAPLRNTALATWSYGVGVAVDAARERVYASAEDARVDIFDLSKVIGPSGEEEYEKIGSIEGSAVPASDFGGYLSLAVDEGDGHVFMLDGQANVVFEFDSDGTYIETIEHSFNVPFGAEIGVDNGPFSPHGASSTEGGRYLYVPSGKTGTGHSYAFEESESRPPVVKSTAASGVTTSEVELQAVVNPGNLETTYIFEYTTEESFEAEGFSGAIVAESGVIPAGNLDAKASAAATGLQAGAAYRFRVVASNEKGSAEMEGRFSTYPTYGTSGTPCENQLLRIGFSASLPDCRAYELVTPADTNGRVPVGVGHEGGNFTTRQVSPAGDKIPFRVEGGTLPGSTGTGSYLGDPFVSSRGANGWNTAFIGPSAAEAVSLNPGWTSPDQGYSFFHAEREGSLVIEVPGNPFPSTAYLRYPDGHVELLGVGSIATDFEATGFLISEGGSHVIFGTGSGPSEDDAIQIEPEAPPSGTRAIYDRTRDGVVHVVSLGPEDTPLKAGEAAGYLGASLDGEGIAFEVNSKTLYLRYQNDETFEIGEDVKYAGIAEGGSRIFYVEDGRLWRFDASTGERTAFSSGTVTPVIIAPDGSAAYFVSTAKLTNLPNPNGASAKLGKQNLYLSWEGELSFVGTVTDRDMVGKFNGKEQVDGLGLWVLTAMGPPAGQFGNVPARASLDGTVLLFQSRAPLAGYDPGGKAQVYRYDLSEERLQCLSCNPTGAAATGDSTLQSENREGFGLFFPQAWLENLRSDGQRAIFQSPEALVPGDNDKRQDVYEWENDGVGSCANQGGCIFLISSGHSARNDYLWSVSASGDDVFFLSADLLLPLDQDETPSIYDARVGGGFPEPSRGECQGEGCRPQVTPPPALPGVQSPVHGVGDNFKPRKCRKGRHKAKRGGKVRCVKTNHRKHRRHRAGSEKKGARK